MLHTSYVECVLCVCPLLQAGVHSGDSACTIPTQSIPTSTLNTIRDWTHKVAEALGVVGLINIQYAIQVRVGCVHRGRGMQCSAVTHFGEAGL